MVLIVSTSIRPWIFISLLSYRQTDVIIYEFQSTNFKGEEIVAHFVLWSIHCFFLNILLLVYCSQCYCLIFMSIFFFRISPHRIENLIISMLTSTFRRHCIIRFKFTVWPHDITAKQLVHEAYNDLYAFGHFARYLNLYLNGSFDKIGGIDFRVFRLLKNSRDSLMVWFTKNLREEEVVEVVCDFIGL